MKRCDWCGKISNTLFSYESILGGDVEICENCNDTSRRYECRKCGTIVDPSTLVDGMCLNCVQIEYNKRTKMREELRAGVSDIVASDTEISEEDYDRWMTLGHTFTSNDLKNDAVLRKLWIIVKFNCAGIYDNKIIDDNYCDIEELLDRNLSNLIGKKCKIVIADTPESRKLIKQSDVIDYKNKTYIIYSGN